MGVGFDEPPRAIEDVGSVKALGARDCLPLIDLLWLFGVAEPTALPFTVLERDPAALDPPGAMLCLLVLIRCVPVEPPPLVLPAREGSISIPFCAMLCRFGARDCRDER